MFFLIQEASEVSCRYQLGWVNFKIKFGFDCAMGKGTFHLIMSWTIQGNLQ